MAARSACPRAVGLAQRWQQLQQSQVQTLAHHSTRAAALPAPSSTLAQRTIAAFRARRPRSGNATALREYLDAVPVCVGLQRRNAEQSRCFSGAVDKGKGKADAELDAQATISAPAPDQAPRNPLGVQLLAPSLNAQVFPPDDDPLPPLHPHAASLAQAHLAAHGLSPSQGSRLPQTNFTLPPLHGKNLGEHFWNIGRDAAQPWLSMAEGLANVDVIPQGPEVSQPPGYRLPDRDAQGRPTPSAWIHLDHIQRSKVRPQRAPWLKQSGWVRYPFLRSVDDIDIVVGEGDPVPYPLETDDALVFDVETMVTAGPYPVMATAACRNAWYAWISPWLLGESQRKDHLIPFSRPGSDPQQQPPRLIVGHNVSYDRARLLDEYTLTGTKIGFMDTQSLHVATRGISSPQRPAWHLHRKDRAQRQAEKLLQEAELQEEQEADLLKLIAGEELDDEDLAMFADMGLDIEALTGSLGGAPPVAVPSLDDNATEGEASKATSWQEISSMNSLKEVAELHCGIQLPKELRNVFVEATSREEILDQFDDLLCYCARDVWVTHAVFSKVLPAFRAACPHPATFAGVLGIGSPILPVDEEWEQYKVRCEAKYEAALSGVRSSLLALAESLRAEHGANLAAGDDQWWRSDPWYAQLDWTPKKAKKPKTAEVDPEHSVPRWYRDYVLGKSEPTAAQQMSAHVLLLDYDGVPIEKVGSKWQAGDEILAASPTSRTLLISKKAGHLVTSRLGSEGEAVLDLIREKASKGLVSAALRDAAAALLKRHEKDRTLAEKAKALDWTPVDARLAKGSANAHEAIETWPKWYWDLFKTATGQLELTVRTKISPLLLKLSWLRCPLVSSREHGWCFMHRRSEQPDFSTRRSPLSFNLGADAHLQDIVQEKRDDDVVSFYKVPHAAGEEANVGSPFSKPFIAFFEDGTLQSEHPDEVGAQTARNAVELNALCSYWIAVRDRVANQMVVWDGDGGTDMRLPPGRSGMPASEPAVPETAPESARKGAIIPQVIAMGTVTRRASENTWLTASNAKKNRVGSELKAMIKAPPGWVIVGADVDSEELWICSVMGDAQFGLHGSTAVGWMTLEGQKSAGTDLHSKTASILGTDRNLAKIFNYSRIYGAGIRHATQLLLKANPGMSQEEATRNSQKLYSKTKGTKTRYGDLFGRKFWFGGSESYVFNKLEEIALSDEPRTPTLGCGITAALSRKFLPSAASASFGGAAEAGAQPANTDFMTSRINWVVQSSGVDYLHLLITSMNHLCKTYDIAARFMLSVHDEVRFLVREDDAHRAALALQISNLWTRAMFAFKLQMEGLPEGVAWFAQVDIDRVLRKEVDDPCVTPSHPQAIPHGEALEIAQILQRTNGGSLRRDGKPMAVQEAQALGNADAYPSYERDTTTHRAVGEEGVLYLQAQASNDLNEIRVLHRRARALTQARQRGGATGESSTAKATKTAPPRAAGTRASDVRVGFAKTASSPSPSSSSSSDNAKKPAKSFLTSSTGGVRASPAPAPRATGTKSSFSTRAAASASSRGRVTSMTTLPTALQDLAACIPLRPGRPTKPRPAPPPTPYHADPRWRSMVLWSLYRPLLRWLPADLPDLKHWLRRRFRRYGALRTREPSARREVLRAREFLEACQCTPPDTAFLSRQSAALVHRREATLASEARAAARKPPVKVPRRSGALLPPSYYNAPMHRYKPQPVKLSMMIRRRIVARRERVQRRLESDEQLRIVRDEAALMARVAAAEGAGAGAAAGADPTGFSAASARLEWEAPLRMHRALMDESFAREGARAGMQFSGEVLREAKAERKRKMKWFSRRKARRREEREAAQAARGEAHEEREGGAKGEGKQKQKGRGQPDE